MVSAATSQWIGSTSSPCTYVVAYPVRTASLTGSAVRTAVPRAVRSAVPVIGDGVGAQRRLVRVEVPAGLHPHGCLADSERSGSGGPGAERLPVRNRAHPAEQAPRCRVIRPGRHRQCRVCAGHLVGAHQHPAERPFRARVGLPVHPGQPGDGVQQGVRTAGLPDRHSGVVRAHGDGRLGELGPAVGSSRKAGSVDAAQK